MTENVCESIANRMGELFTCSRANEYIRIRTPYLYPDGDVIDLFLSEHEDRLTLTDLGESLRWLTMQSLARQKSPNQRQLIQDLFLNHGLELYKGMLTVRLISTDTLAAAF